MGLEFLARVRRTSLWIAAVAALFAAVHLGLAAGLATALGAAWCLVNLSLLERLVVALTGADRGTPGAAKRAGFALLGMAALFGAGAVLLSRLPPIALLCGFLLPFAALVLKAASILLLQSSAWRRLVASRWRAAALVGVLLLAAWWVVPSALRGEAPAAATGGAQSAAEHGTAAEHGSAGEHGGAAERAERAEAEGPQKFANFITILSRAFPDAPWARFLHHYEVVIFALLIGGLICLVAFFATRGAQMIPGPLQNVVEMLVGGLNDFITGILGPKHAARYVPFLGTLFIYIWCMNLFGLVPFMESPTSSLNITVALAITVFVYAQYIGLRGLGLVGYLDHLVGNPRNATGWALVPLMLPIHVLGELAKPISLSCRLFGNIFGEDMLLVAFVTLGITTLPFAQIPFGLPLQLPFLFLALLTSTLQALVFTVLSTIYFLLMLPHDDHGHEGEAQPAH